MVFVQVLLEVIGSVSLAVTKTDYKSHWGIFTLSVEGIGLGFALQRYGLVIGSKNSRRFPSQSQVKSPWLVHKGFPAFYASHVYFLWVLIGSLECLCPLLLVKDVTLEIWITQKSLIYLYIFYTIRYIPCKLAIYKNIQVIYGKTCLPVKCQMAATVSKIHCSIFQAL